MEDDEDGERLFLFSASKYANMACGMRKIIQIEEEPRGEEITTENRTEQTKPSKL